MNDPIMAALNEFILTPECWVSGVLAVLVIKSNDIEAAWKKHIRRNR